MEKDARYACPHCHANTLQKSVGDTGREKAATLLESAEKALPDEERELIAAVRKVRSLLCK